MQMVGSGVARVDFGFGSIFVDRSVAMRSGPPLRAPGRDRAKRSPHHGVGDSYAFVYFICDIGREMMPSELTIFVYFAPTHLRPSENAD